MTQSGSFIDQLQDFLEYQKEEGVQTLELSPETLAALKPAENTPPLRDAPRQTTTKPAPRPALARRTSKSKPGTTTSVGKVSEKSAVQVTGKTLEEIAGQIRTCNACPLYKSRKNTVPGEGNPSQPDILFIGEDPGADEDTQGRPFVGAAGQLLDKMINAMGYKREEVFITNMVKCRPPGNRVPLPEERTACIPYLKAQIALLQPKTIVALGKTAAEGLLNEPVAITRMRGTWKTYEGIDLMPTFHPAYLLRSPGKKREVWTDLQAVLAKLGKEPPAKKTS